MNIDRISNFNGKQYKYTATSGTGECSPSLSHERLSWESGNKTNYNYVNNQKRNGVSFEGKGNLVVTYQKFSKEIGQKLGGIFNNSTSGNIKRVLIKNGLMDKSGNMLTLAPKKVVITDGEGSFDESLLQGAQFIFQKGGHLEKEVSAKTIALSGGTHSGLIADTINLIKYDTSDSSQKIVAEELRARNNSKIYNNTVVKKDAFLTDSHISTPLGENDSQVMVPKTQIDRNLNLYGNSSVKNVKVGNDLLLWDNSMVGYAEVGRNAVLHDTSKAYKLNVKYNLLAEDNSRVKNAEVGSRLDLLNHSIVEKVKVGYGAALRDYSKAYKLKVGNELDLLNDSSVINAKVGNIAFLFNDSTANGLKVDRLDLHDNSRVKKAVVGSNAFLHDTSEAEGVNVECDLELWDNSRVKKAVVGKNAFLYGTSEAEDVKVEHDLWLFDNSSVENTEVGNNTILYN